MKKNSAKGNEGIKVRLKELKKYPFLRKEKNDKRKKNYEKVRLKELEKYPFFEKTISRRKAFVRLRAILLLASSILSLLYLIFLCRSHFRCCLSLFRLLLASLYSYVFLF